MDPVENLEPEVTSWGDDPQGPDVSVYLSADAEVTILDDGVEFGLRFFDGHAEVIVDLPRRPEAYFRIMSFAQRIRKHEPEIRIRTIGYQDAQHNAHTGPGR